MNNYYNALSEVSTILQHLELKELKKIPTEIIKDIEENKNLEYTYEIDNEKKLSEQKMLPETQAILSILYRDYIHTVLPLYNKQEIYLFTLHVGI